MMAKNNSKNRLVSKVFGFIFAIVFIFSSLFGTGLCQDKVYAEPETSEEVVEEDETEEVVENETEEEAESETSEATETAKADANSETNQQSGIDQCQSSLGSIGWLVCPVTGKVAEATDWLYDKIESILAIDPIEAKDGTPIYEIWKYCRGLTNIVFIIFLLVVIYSQITGVGISNYGIKKVLPKMIVVAVLVNVSFLLCSLAVDVSNVIGNSLRGVFTTVQESAVANMATNAGMTAAEMKMSQAGMYNALAGGAALAVGAGVIAFETGTIWMLIPVLLGALVSVVTGLITISLRQAVVALLVMIAPLAIVAYMLPNTEGLFRKWKDLLMKMLVFYPMFAVLFGASQLAGFAIIAGAKDGFMLLVGVAVQIFPLFFSWKMMKMSGTVLGTINGGMQRLMAAPLAKNQAWADSHRQLTKQRYLASDRAYTPSLRLNQWLNDRKVAREAETADKAALVKNRGLAYRSNLNYDKNGVPTRRGKINYRDQALSMGYQEVIERDKNNMDKGLGGLASVEKFANKTQKAELANLDLQVMNASDLLKMEKTRGEKIAYDNAKGFHERMEKAINAHMDATHGYEMHEDEYILDANGVKIKNPKYKFHPGLEGAEFDTAMWRYNAALDIMEGNFADVQFAAATAARSYDTQKKMIETAYQKYFELTPPTKDLEYRLDELTKMADAGKYIDTIIPGLRILNQRGDTDLTLRQIKNVLEGEGGIQLGTHASQALASFLMFEVKDNDPFMRRFGKYINLETANAFNKNVRQAMDITYDEYIKGYHVEPNGEVMYAKRGIKELMEGTSLDNIERTAMPNLDESLRAAYTDKDGHLDTDAYLRKRDEIETAMGPQVISASLKYLSGSEQLKSMVKFKTGFDYKQLKETYIDENGERKERVVTDENGEPVYVWEPIWAEGRDDFDKDSKEKARKYFEEKTLRYLLDQTPTQILGLRSDYKEPLMEHLAQAYEENDDMTGWSEEAIAERNKYMREKAEIQTRYGDLPGEERRARQEADLKALRKAHRSEWAGAQFRQLLDSKGKLNQIYRTRRSGAANNAKDWVREWLDLDNEIAITKKLDNDRKKEKRAEEEKRRHEGVPEDDGAVDAGAIYTDDDRAMFATKIYDLWQDYRDEDDEVFFEKSLEYVKGLHLDYIAKQYEKFHEDDPLADSHMLREVLEELLSEPGNY